MTEAPQAPAPAGPPANPGKGLSIAGLVLGIVGLALVCAWYIGIPCAVVGLILSILGKKKSKAAGAPTGMATAGMVLSIIALAVLIVVAILVAVVGVALFGAASQMQKQLQDANIQQLLDLIPIF